MNNSIISLHTSALEVRGFSQREDLGTECRRECALGHMVCGRTTGRVQCWKKVGLHVSHIIFSLYWEKSDEQECLSYTIKQNICWQRQAMIPGNFPFCIFLFKWQYNKKKVVIISSAFISPLLPTSCHMKTVVIINVNKK